VCEHCDRPLRSFDEVRFDAHDVPRCADDTKCLMNVCMKCGVTQPVPCFKYSKSDSGWAIFCCDICCIRNDYTKALKAACV
jgi:hypothetical protein